MEEENKDLKSKSNNISITGATIVVVNVMVDKDGNLLDLGKTVEEIVNKIKEGNS